MARLTSVNLSHQNMSVKYEITVKQMFKISKNLLKTLIGDLINKTLLNIFRNYIPNKKCKCDYRQPPWMTNSIKKSLKERSKLTKCYYKNGQKKSDYEKLLEKSSDCTKEILEAKNNYILKMTTSFKNQRLLQKRTGLF